MVQIQEDPKYKLLSAVAALLRLVVGCGTTENAQAHNSFSLLHSVLTCLQR
jgi:hypothetical protein